MNRNNRIPITRNKGWYTEKDFDVDLEMARSLIEGDMNYRLILFRVDLTKTDTDDLYGEVDVEQINYLPPVELKVKLFIDEGENKEYQTGLRIKTPGTLTFNIYMAHLKEKNVDISYGDFIGYNIDENTMVYYQVFDDGKANFDNKHTRYGYKPYYRTIMCKYTDENLFNG
jgi:hypothetical protein